MRKPITLIESQKNVSHYHTYNLGKTDTDMGMCMTRQHKQLLKKYNMKQQLRHRYNMNTTWDSTLNEVFLLSII